MRIVGEAEAFFGNSDEVAVETGVAIFVMNDGDAVVAGRQILPGNEGLARIGRNGGRTVTKGFVFVFGPAIG